jgi:hypothetical protein
LLLSSPLLDMMSSLRAVELVCTEGLLRDVMSSVRRNDRSQLPLDNE